MYHGDVKFGDILVAQKHYLPQASISDLLKSCLKPDPAQRMQYLYIYIYTIFWEMVLYRLHMYNFQTDVELSFLQIKSPDM
jgi:hypothetical protein